MLLAVDVGNTRIKVAVFEDGMFLESLVYSKENFQKNLENLINKFKNCTDLVVASVGNIEKEVFLSFEKELKVHFITSTSEFPFINKYATPLTLGIDRMVLASGAVLQFPNQNRLIVDAGTCITYDFVDKEDNYLGGAISPGIRLRYESLHNHTANLPLLTQENEVESVESFIGNSTATSIHSGVLNGVINEIDGFINQYEEKYPNFIIILTGGDANFLAKRLKNTIFANSNFLLESLNQLFQHKTKND